MKYQVNLQNVSQTNNMPNRFTLQRWVNETLVNHIDTAEITIRIVDAEESRHLNDTYRSQNKPTNVLSFPSSIPDDIPLPKPLLGDLIICAPVVETEAADQNKELEHHWAHMVIHGLLHLLGFDHLTDQQAAEMEELEISIMINMGYPNPYGDADSND